MSDTNRNQDEMSDAEFHMRRLFADPVRRQAMKSHMFEYWIYCDSETHRIGRCRHEDQMPLIEEWVQGQFQKPGKTPSLLTKPIYMFMDGALTLGLKYEGTVSDDEGRMAAKFHAVDWFGGTMEAGYEWDDMWTCKLV